MTFHSAFTQQNNATNSAKEEHWIPLADLMAGLMMIFMLIAIILMGKVESDAK